MLHNILSILPILVCVFWAILLLIGDKGNLSKRYLAFFLFLLVINYTIHALYFNDQYKFFAFCDNVWIFTSLAGYPLYYYYIRLLTTDKKINWRWIWILAPSICLSIFSFIIYIFMSPNELDIFIHGIMYHEVGYSAPYPDLVNLQIFCREVFKVVFIIQIIAVVYCGFKLVINHNRSVRSFYSNTYGKDFFVEKKALLFIPSIAHSLFLFFIGYVGYRQDFTISRFNKDVEEYNKHFAEICNNNEKQLKSGREVLDKLKEQMIILFEKAEIYKNPNLRITDIAIKLYSNKTYISRIVNEDFNTNFCDFVNSYRVLNAKKLLSSPQFVSVPLFIIAENCGFLSESSFYRVFKGKTGISSGEFRAKFNNSIG